MKQPIIVTKITTNEEGISIFSKNNFDVNKRGGMFLTDQIAAKNFRLRRSDVGYSTQFHLAGDATFIIILKGSLKIELQNGDFIIFNVGESFTAEDNLPESITFNDKIHGHEASVIGDEPLEAIHIKL